MFRLPVTFLCGSLLAPILAFGQSAATPIPAPANGTDLNSPIVYASPATGALQGYATDGTNHYLFSTTNIQEDNDHWDAIYSNTSPFAGLPPGVTHVGDGAYYDGKLYAPVEAFSSCDNFSHQTIGVYSANTTGLALANRADISADRHEVSSVAVVPSTNSLYVSSFCDGSKLWIYDLTTLSLKGTLALSANIAKIQGISWNPARKQFAVTADSADQKTGYIYLVSPAGIVTGPVFTASQRGELEGVDYTQNTIRYLIGGSVYFLYVTPGCDSADKLPPDRR